MNSSSELSNFLCYHDVKFRYRDKKNFQHYILLFQPEASKFTITWTAMADGLFISDIAIFHTISDT